MNRLAAAVATLALSAAVGFALAAPAGEPLLEPGIDSIRGEDVDAVLAELTSDAYAGRDTPQPGLARACDWVAERFRAIGLAPPDGGDGYFWRYGLDVRDADASCALIVAREQRDAAEHVLRAEFIPAARSAEGIAEGDLVFAGFGIKETEYRWNDYDVPVRGRIALVLAGEPRSKNAKWFDGPGELSDAASLAHKVRAAADEGAAGVLVAGATEADATLWLDGQLPVLASGRRGDGGGPRPGDLPIPTAIVSAALAEDLLGEPPAALVERMDGKRRSQSREVPGTRVRLEVKFVERDEKVPNVVGLYRGSDPQLASEVVVIGAHLDHIGTDDRGRVYRGADDNAGGCAALLEVAEAFASASPPVKRSILFIAFTGEERGLLGSRAYVQTPAVPMDQTYCMINMDIISRGRRQAIEATMPPKSSCLDRLLPQAVKLSGARMKVGDGGKEFFQRSDHFSFHEAGVPTLFFNEGVVNDDYHKWTDTPDKVLDDKVADVAKITFCLAWLAANSDLAGGLK